MSFDPLVSNAGRLQILTALAVDGSQEFVRLRESTQLTDGNLASHARRLRSAGFIAIDKQFRAGKPVTSFTLTVEGRRALEIHTRRLIAAISHRRLAPAPVSAQPTPLIPALAPISAGGHSDEEWVD